MIPSVILKGFEHVALFHVLQSQRLAEPEKPVVLVHRCWCRYCVRVYPHETYKLIILLKTYLLISVIWLRTIYDRENSKPARPSCSSPIISCFHLIFDSRSHDS